ncbi:unnamed protein product [Nezara viridula]|uniref:Uncharacterized protein n=1 Tax=Nezara viridula TaxID=85310 RepID=A0A9P0H3Y9_NEZVI|nr:unnamed protein product [Nezara viridula]
MLHLQGIEVVRIRNIILRSYKHDRFCLQLLNSNNSIEQGCHRSHKYDVWTVTCPLFSMKISFHSVVSCAIDKQVPIGNISLDRRLVGTPEAGEGGGDFERNRGWKDVTTVGGVSPLSNALIDHAHYFRTSNWRTVPLGGDDSNAGRTETKATTDLLQMWNCWHATKEFLTDKDIARDVHTARTGSGVPVTR